MRFTTRAALIAALLSSASTQAGRPESPAGPSELDRLQQRLDDANKRIDDLEAKLKNLEKATGMTLPPGAPDVGSASELVPDRAKVAKEMAKAEHRKFSESEATAIAEKCPISGATADVIVDNPKPFAAECLAPIVDSRDKKTKVLDTGWNRFDSLRLGLELVGNKHDSVVDVTPSYTKRWVRPSRGRLLSDPTNCPHGPDASDCAYRSNYLTIRLGVSAPLDPGGERATFADLTKFERASGVALIGALELGNSRWTKRKDAVNATKDLLDEAAKECIADKRSGNIASPFKPDGALLVECRGMALTDWIADEKHKDRRQKYYGKLILGPIYNAPTGDDDPPPVLWFAGIEGSYAQSKYSFLPLVDRNGEPVVPPPQISDEVQQKHDLYAIKVYGGRGLGEQKFLDAGDISASLTYRRDFTYADGTADEDVCAPSNTVIRCSKKNIAAPIKLQGFVAGARVAGKFPTFGFLPSSAIELRGTYDFQAHRYGLEVPIYFIVNDKNRPHGGVMFSCTGDGRLHGRELPGDCKGAIFLGTEFKLDRR